MAYGYFQGLMDEVRIYSRALSAAEATLTLTAGRDRTREGVGGLSLWFRGAATNAAERMYVVLCTT
jgi:hypothetical protein